jgi:hypothetical protein
MKASGFARYDAGTGTWTLVDNFVTSSRRAGSRENVLRMAPGGGSYTVISSRIDGQPLVSNGVEVRTGQPMPPRHRCGPDSAAARAIPSWEEIRAQPDRLAFPQPPGSPQAPSAGPAEQAPAQAAQRPSAAGGRESAERSERGGKPAVVEALAVNDIIAEPGRYLGRTVAVACDTVWRSSSGKSITCDSSRGTEIDVDAGSLDRASFRYVLDRCGNNDQCSACAIGQVARSGNSLVLRNVRLHMMIFGFCSTEMPLGG